MKIALMHYHLKTGGVATVIRHQAHALKAMGWDVAILSGEPAPEEFPARVSVVPELRYDSVTGTSCQPDIISKNVMRALHRIWPAGADIVHVHNPTLAKNRQVQAVLKNLQEAGVNLLCQIHDFAEDGRPSAYYQENYVPDCHYAVINPRDHRLLIQSGLKAEGCHLLPNTVMPLEIRRHSSKVCQHVIYPIRAIRRKNIGEAILLSLYFKPGVPLAVTLPPNSPMDIISYDCWRTFSDRLGLEIQFEMGLKYDFADLMAGCRYVLTTSISEGFGFAFLEPWTAGIPVWGRRLADICRDFEDQGIQLDHLYDRLWVPLAWVDTASVEQKWKNTMQKAAQKFGYPLEPDEVEAGWTLVTRDERIDFGLLDEGFQQQIIEQVRKSPRKALLLKKINPFLNHPGPPSTEEFQSVIERNRRFVAEVYHPDQYARRLQRLYTCVANTPVRHSIHKKRLVSAFLAPQNLSLLKWGGVDV